MLLTAAVTLGPFIPSWVILMSYCVSSLPFAAFSMITPLRGSVVFSFEATSMPSIEVPSPEIVTNSGLEATE